MINYFCLFCSFYCNILLFCQPVKSHSVKHKHLKNPPDLLLITESTENNIERNYFIAGFWRGFHEFEELTVYYAYQFRNDNSFLARHRIYENNKTIEDINLQGEWQFKDDRLEIKGVGIKEQTQPFIIKFQLRDDFKLVYETGSLSDAYQLMMLNKIGRLSQ